MKISIVLLFTCFLTGIQAQNYLAITHPDRKDTLYVDEGDLLKLAYHGYLGVPEETSGKVVQITDSVIVFGHFHGGSVLETHRVALHDITGFHKFRRSKNFWENTLKFVVSLGVLIGISTALNESLSSPQIAVAAAVGGLASFAAVEFLFEKKIKRHLADGWTLHTMPYPD